MVADDACAEAERRYPNIQPRALAEAYHEVFVAGAEWAAARAETTTELYPCLPSLGEPCGNCHRCTDPPDPMANVLDDCRYCQGTGMATLNPDEEPGSHVCVPAEDH